MKLNRYWLVLVLVFGMMMIAGGAQAQCHPSTPRQLNLYDSYCVHICPDSASIFFLSCPFMGPEMYPHLIMSPGCHSGAQGCNSDCTPVTPPAWPWAQGQRPEFGQDPGQPDAIVVQNDCMSIYVYWNHGGYWVIEILANECSGCFCLWFDWQLPVQLTSFDAVSSDGRVTLNWNTASESTNDRFEIVRQDRGMIASVRSEGNGPTGHHYVWQDNNVENGHTYTYHLRSVDYNNQTDELSTIQATPAFTAATVSEYALYQNYPNPFNPSTRIMFDVPATSMVKLNIFNPVGQHVASLVDGSLSVGRYAVSFDGSNLPSGLYFYSVKIGDNFSATRKMLLVK